VFVLAAAAAADVGAAGVGAAGVVEVPDPHCTPDDPSFEYFELMLQWPPAYDHNGSKLGKRISHWTIHGLWPSRIEDPVNYPCQCSTEPFDESKLETIMKDMNFYWPSLETSDYANFWAHEWEKHGTCCMPYLKTQMQYFETTLGLRKSLDPGSLLDDMKPSADTAYSYHEINARLSAGGDIVLHCRSETRFQGSMETKVQALVEVMICITASGTPSQFNCPDNVRAASHPVCDPAKPVYILPSEMPSLEPRAIVS